MTNKSRYYKPPAPQPSSPPKTLLSAADPRSRKRAARFEANEAKQPFEKRLVNRTDLAERGRKRYSLRWLKRMDSEMHLWAEFLFEQYQRTDALSFFTEGGQVPTIELLNHTSIGSLSISKAIFPSPAMSHPRLPKRTELPSKHYLFIMGHS